MSRHPLLDEHGNVVELRRPSVASPLEAWTDHTAIATVVPLGRLPDSVNGLSFVAWTGPSTDDDWMTVEGQSADVIEPSNDGITTAGAVVLEPDGRVWLISPSNAYGGYEATFPKGKADGLYLQATAIKEVFEETGLKIEITGFVADSKRTTSTARFYLGKRVGGSPARMGWESQAVHLVPVSKLHAFLNSPMDRKLAEEVVRLTAS